MTRKLVVFALLIAGGLSLATTNAWAQRTSPDTDRSGTAGASWLLLPTTARSASLGSALSSGVSTMNGIEASFENPANLVLSQGTGALFSRMNYVADIAVNTFGVSQSIGSNSIGVTVSSWDYGDIPVTTEDDPDVDETTPTWSASNVMVGLNYARTFTDRIAAGVTIKAVSERMAEDMNASSFSFDAGMTYTVGESGLRFGVALRNFGPSMAYYGDGLKRDVTVAGDDGQTVAIIEAEDFELPSLLNFGVSYRRELASQLSATVLGNFRSNSYEEDQYTAALELGLRDIVYVRGGYQWQANLNEMFFEGWNVGAGLNLNFSGTQIQVDYAYRPTNIMSGVQMLTASVVL